MVKEGESECAAQLGVRVFLPRSISCLLDYSGLDRSNLFRRKSGGEEKGAGAPARLGPLDQAAVDGEHLRLGAVFLQALGGEPRHPAVFIRLFPEGLPLPGGQQEEGEVQVEVG